MEQPIPLDDPIKYLGIGSLNAIVLWDNLDSWSKTESASIAKLFRTSGLHLPVRVRHSEGPPFRRAAIPKQCHSKGLSPQKPN